jgi:uncharacterized membrane protein
MIFDLAILVLALCGFFVARHIRKHKIADIPLVCMVGFDCHTVVHSDYSKFLRIPVEVLGMVYYALIFLFYLLPAFSMVIMPISFLNFIGLISLLAVVFSVYLIIVQIFVLRKGCSWCFVSAFISILIFVLSVIK